MLSQGASGLRLSGWLARRGVAVRHLGIGPREAAVPWSSFVFGERSVLEPWFGPVIDVAPSRAILREGRLVDLAARRRDLARFAGGSLAGLARDLRPRALGATTAGDWGVANLGRAAWTELLSPLLGKLLGGAPDELPATVAGLWVGSRGARGWSCAGDAAEMADASAEAVLQAGGEPLEDVTVEGIEVEAGRVVAVQTEFGREHVDDVLYTDLPPSRLAELLPAGLVPPDQVAATRALRTTDTAVVTVGADVARLPWEVWLADPEVPVLRVLRAWGRPGEPRPDRVDVEVLDDGLDDDALRGRAVEGLGPLARVRDVGAVRRVPGAWPRPTTDPIALAALARLDALGIVGVGGRALHLPLTPAHEARLAASWAAARTPADALAELLTAPRSVRSLALLP